MTTGSGSRRGSLSSSGRARAPSPSRLSQAGLTRCGLWLAGGRKEGKEWEAGCVLSTGCVDSRGLQVTLDVSVCTSRATACYRRPTWGLMRAPAYQPSAASTGRWIRGLTPSLPLTGPLPRP